MAKVRATIAVNMTPPGKDAAPDFINHIVVPFEWQVLPLDQMLIAGSDHTVTSHEHSYVPEREFETIFRILRPPMVYGTKFAKYALQGYKSRNGHQVPLSG